MGTGRGELPGLGDIVADKYMLRRVVGEGGMGIVFQAEHVRLRQPAAIKFLHPKYLDQALIVARFDGEARAVARLRGVHVVRVLDVDVLPSGVPYMVQEYLEGRDLHAELRDLGQLPIETAVDYICQAAYGIHEAHELGIVHRDLKPGNLFLSELPNTPRRLVRVLDFGISTSVSDDEHSRLTGTDDTLGTAPYMSPEQMRASRDVDGRSDVWSLGVILFELLTGSKPFKGTRSAVAVAITLDPAPFPTLLRPDIPPRLEKLILRALEKSPADRFASAKELAIALTPFGPIEPISTWIGAGTTSPHRDAALEADVAVETSSTLPQPAEAAAPLSEAPAPALVEAPAALAEALVAVVAPSNVLAEAIIVPPVRKKIGARRALLLGIGVVAVLGVALGVARNRFTKISEAPASVNAGIAPVAARECSTNAECMGAHAGAAWICRKDSFKCMPLEFPDCKLLSEPGDVANDRTIWLGAMFPETGRRAASGNNAFRAIDLARRDFLQMTHGIPPLVGKAAPRPLAIVTCDDAKNGEAVARHLVDDVGAPAILGFGTSQEVIDLATSIFIPKHVLTVATSDGSSLITAIPQPEGTPRMVWRSTTSTSGVVLPIAAVVASLLEPKLRSGHKGQISPLSQIRVALVRRGDAYGQSLSGALFQGLRFNEKSVLENGANFREYVMKEGVTSSTTADDLLKFRPHIILSVNPSRDAMGVLESVEARWPARESFKPYTIFPGGFAPEIFGLLGTNKERRGRFLGLATPSTTLPNAQFTAHYNEVFPNTKVTLDINPAETYDGMYLVAYAAAVAGENVTGTELARAMSRLVPSGKPIDVGPLHIFEAIEALRRGENIDLDGAMTPLDFDLATGETPANYVVQCAGVNEKGAAFDAIDSGMIYKGTTKRLVGTMLCP